MLRKARHPKLTVILLIDANQQDREYFGQLLLNPSPDFIVFNSTTGHPGCPRGTVTAFTGDPKQVRDRDRQIAILRSQLEALKLIDEDDQEKQRKVKPPASLIPTAEQSR